MTTIKEVAEMAEVSVATVSRYLNNPSVVSPGAAQRIAAAVETLRYLPNRLARNLRTTSSKYILALMPSVENSFLPHVIRGIQNVGAAKGYSVLIGVTQSDGKQEQNYLNLVQSRGVDGVITISPVSGAELLKELSAECPVIQCSEYVTQEIPFVTINNRSAAREITKVLIEHCGSRRPALISSDLPILSFREREEGYRQALEEAGITPDPALTVKVPLGYNAGKKAAAKLIDAKPDSILAVADIVALGAMRYLLDAGYKIPGDISVAGFDGIPFAREFRPSLSTVIQPGFEIGKTAASLMIDLITKKAVQKENILPYRIALRQSTRLQP